MSFDINKIIISHTFDIVHSTQLDPRTADICGLYVIHIAYIYTNSNSLVNGQGRQESIK